jgi:hypothetical protein
MIKIPKYTIRAFRQTLFIFASHELEAATEINTPPISKAHLGLSGGHETAIWPW